MRLDLVKPATLQRFPVYGIIENERGLTGADLPGQ
jgi:hypothetical protein